MKKTASHAPDFIVIGAQKCGTTTLYTHLERHPQIQLSAKEESALVYESLPKYSESPQDGHTLGDVSTRYAMAPDTDVASSAHRIAPEAKVVYIVRDPLDRLVSHHHHDLGLNLVPADINVAVGQFSNLINYSRYAYQLDPWLSLYGPSSVLVLSLSDLSRAPSETMSAVYSFLGVRPHAVDSSLRENAHDSKSVPSSLAQRVSSNHIYRQYIRPYAPPMHRLRRSLGLFRAPPKRPAYPSQMTIDLLNRALDQDAKDFPSATRRIQQALLGQGGGTA